MPDLSYLDVVYTPHITNLVDPPRVTKRPEPARKVVRKSAASAPSKQASRNQARADQRRAQRKTALISPARATALAGVPLLKRVQAHEPKGANRNVRHSPNSTLSRLEKMRPNTCKERPADNRPTGRGSGKPYVPWCGRRT